MTQQNTQAVILQQPNDQIIRLDLQHSTDTTAIWSFVIAMVVAFILGISATIIAIWYGRKSFVLTKQSFDVVVKQIQSSETTTLESNRQLIDSQSCLAEKNHERDFENKKYEDLKNAAVNYIVQSENYRMYMFILSEELKKFQFDKESAIGSFQRAIVEEIRQKLHQILEKKTLLRFSLYNYYEDFTLTALVHHIHELDKMAFKLHSCLIANEKDNFGNILEEYKQYIIDVEATLISTLKNR
ncbi:hypothetical protein SKM57_02705 [Acinetobacter faecalis]|uniref:hypothetical protein n=1 Tax=Acinetobacter faecalis TaxID=2665161 RepID=UPI002A91E9F3|nr:hypothetical protein [Acinetobacter faecalis]MDY6456954.1 hypothetical protein [Acinetobacter faecalis]MDY6467494.1 hypothetical protein [Acinetobacter faecalis]